MYNESMGARLAVVGRLTRLSTVLSFSPNVEC